MASSSSSSSSSTPWSSYFENSDEITQDGKVLIKLSDRKPLFIVPDVFREKVYINIREYYLNKREEEEEGEEEEEDDDEEENTPYLFPTKKGVCFTEEEFKVFLNKIARVKSVVKRLKKEKTKSAENSKSADKRRSREDRQMDR